VIPRAPWRQDSIGSRIIVLFLGLLLAVQLAGFSAMRASLSAHARRELPTRLLEGQRLLQTLLDRKVQTLTDGARLLAADYGFREALSTGDQQTIASVLENHGARIGATVAGLLTTDFVLHATTGPTPSDLAPLIQRLAAQASIIGRGNAIALLAGRPYQAVLVPVKAPLVIGWVLMAFPLDPQLAVDLRSLSGLDLTLLTRSAPTSPWITVLTSLDTVRSASLVREPWTGGEVDEGMASVATPEEELGVRAMPLGAGQEAGVLALLSLSVDDAIRLPKDLQFALVAINLVGLVVFLMGSVFTARWVTTPLRGLAAAAERLGAGDYATPMQGLERRDEIGELSQAFERMRGRVAENQAQILRLAYWDGLTGLPNRTRFRAAVDEAIAQAAPGASIALILLDLDRFKHVNDVLGHRVGDALLGQIADRMQHHVVREGDMVARLGGDEFGFLVRGGGEAAIAVAQRIARALELPIELEEHRVDISAGIGVACWPAHAEDGGTLLVRAEMAMVAAKRRGDGPLVYDPGIDVTSAQTLTLMTELRHAVERGELRLYLQPKLSLDDCRVVGAEALVRWEHPQRGLVPPMQFVPFAEQTGFIRVLTMWIFEEAARHWKTLVEEGHDLTLSVNLSTRDLMDQELPRKFQALLVKHLVPASALCLEITESAIMDDPQRALVTLDALSAMGFRLSIDDFGTGYSSLAYLKRLPVDELKIDQSFVIGMRADADDEMIVRSTIDLAHNLGIVVVAEGVENGEVWDLLREMHCDQAQGFHMGQPMPVGEFSSWSLGWYAAQPMADADPLRLLH
jgi:diguanylate cyclase (GGDEF)-like protein